MGQINMSHGQPCVYAYAKKAKNRKINDQKGGDKQRKQES